MTAQIIDGKAIAEAVRAEIVAEVEKLAARGVKPGVATILVGDDGGAQFYRGQIEKNTGTVGFAYFNHTLPAGTTQTEVLDLIAALNADRAVHGILALMPMAGEIDQNAVFNAIAPIKDLDCVNPANIGHVLLGDFLFAPATPSACMEILAREGVDLMYVDDEGKDRGLNVTIVNHSNIVGKPAALLCLNKNATVHVVHVFSKDVPAACREADVLICAAPVQNLIKKDMVKPGAVVVDVTTIRIDGKQVGSLEFARVCEVASKVTPVPGGVGPVTNVILLKNALAACKAQTGTA
jgi:methylenetetrahydrofolate dehydrogenase (NADP+)/methenyltetrahydrofolate cyclohydrolase